MTLLSTLIQISSGVLALFDTASDITVLESLCHPRVFTNGTQIPYESDDLFRACYTGEDNKFNFFLIQGFILLFANIAIAYQLWLKRRDVFHYAVEFILTCLAFFDLHWIFFFILVLTMSGRKDKMYEWYGSTLLIEIVLETIPGLLLQLYIVLADQSGSLAAFVNNNLAQFVKILFSFVMAGRTMYTIMTSYLPPFKGPAQGNKDHQYKISSGTSIVIFMFVYSSLLSRAAMIVMAALAFGGLVFVFYAIAIAIRFLKSFVPSAKYDMIAAVSPAKLLEFLQAAMAAFMRDQWQDTLLATLSFLEITIISILILDPFGFNLVGGSNQLLRGFAFTSLGAMVVRIFTNYRLKARVKGNTALVEKLGEAYS